MELKVADYTATQRPDVALRDLAQVPCRVYFVRHGSSYKNEDVKNEKRIVDSPLSVEGKRQARGLWGPPFRHVFCSPLRRALETLLHSRLQYDTWEETETLREHVQDASSLLGHEVSAATPEPLARFWTRVHRFQQHLETVCQNYAPTDRVLIVGHGFFFNGWYRNGSYTAPPHATLLRLK